MDEVAEAGSLGWGGLAEGELGFEQDAGEGGVEFAVQDGGCGGAAVARSWVRRARALRAWRTMRAALERARLSSRMRALPAFW